MKCTLLDTQTGRTVDVDDGTTPFDWSENNWSCDCNRRLYFGEELSNTGYCDGCHRFLVVKAEETSYSLWEFNSEYPPELLAKHAIFKDRQSLMEFMNSPLSPFEQAALKSLSDLMEAMEKADGLPPRVKWFKSANPPMESSDPNGDNIQVFD